MRPTESRWVAISIASLGDLLLHGYSLSAHCGRRECGRHVQLEIEVLIGRLGAGHSYLAPDLVPRLRCRECGGRNIGLTLHANQGYPPHGSNGLRSTLQA